MTQSHFFGLCLSSKFCLKKGRFRSRVPCHRHAQMHPTWCTPKIELFSVTEYNRNTILVKICSREQMKSTGHNNKILTYSMMQRPFWEANWFAASQEIPRISRNPNVHYRTHKRPSPVSILGQHNPVHIPTSYLLEIRPNIIYLSTPRSLQWSPFFRFRQHNRK